MNILPKKFLFLHRNFPAQFKNLIKELATNSDNEICFITNNKEDQIAGVRKIVYKLDEKISDDSSYQKYFNEAIIHAQAAAACASQLKEEGFIPDVIYTHSWGPSTFIKDIFPDVPLVCYFEWFYNAENSDFDFFKKDNSADAKLRLNGKNAHILLDLAFCDAGITPTEWQKSQFPKEFQDKITVIHDGIDTEICKPDENAKIQLRHCETSSADSDKICPPKQSCTQLIKNGKILTYATRGMEAYRGFVEFMMAASVLMKKYPDLQVIVAGEDKIFYGPQLPDTTYKKVLTEKLEFDKSRLHFTGKLSYGDYVKLLQSSTAHVYSTCPFVLSWSILEAMACGCAVVASNTQPVQEVIKDGENGLLFDFFNVGELIEKIEFVFNNPEKMKEISYNARETVVKNYSLEKIMPNQLDFLKKTSGK